MNDASWDGQYKHALGIAETTEMPYTVQPEPAYMPVRQRINWRLGTAKFLLMLAAGALAMSASMFFGLDIRLPGEMVAGASFLTFLGSIFL